MLAILVAICIGLASAGLGWVRASRREGADNFQYAVAYGFLGFLVFMVTLVLSGRFGLLG